MKLRILASLAMAATLAAISAAADQQRSPVAQQCQSVLRGAQAMEVMPAYAVWERLFDRISQGDRKTIDSLRLEPTAMAKVADSALRARQRARELRAVASGADANIAAAILESRDEIIRGLSKAAFAQVSRAAKDVSLDLSFTLRCLESRSR